MTLQPCLTVDVYFDLICPWCLIGKRHLDAALARWAHERPEVPVRVRWCAYPLLPAVPAAGLDYRAFYLARLGDARAVAARRAQVQEAARAAGLELPLALERIEVLPNTLAGHRLIQYAAQAHGAAAAGALTEELFTRYFIAAQHIGDPEVLRAAADACGIRAPGPVHDDAPWLPPPAVPQAPPRWAGQGVPLFVFGGRHGVSGARPAAVLFDAMQQALAFAPRDLAACG